MKKELVCELRVHGHVLSARLAKYPLRYDLRKKPRKAKESDGVGKQLIARLRASLATGDHHSADCLIAALEDLP